MEYRIPNEDLLACRRFLSAGGFLCAARTPISASAGLRSRARLRLSIPSRRDLRDDALLDRDWISYGKGGGGVGGVTVMPAACNPVFRAVFTEAASNPSSRRLDGKASVPVTRIACLRCAQRFSTMRSTCSSVMGAPSAPRFQYFSSSTVSGFQCVGGSGLITRFSMPGIRVLADQE
jgi:hypothetical protein